MPLAIVALNLAFLIGLDITIRLFEGWTLGSVVLLGLWLAFGASPWRWLLVPAAAATAALVSSGALHDTIFRRGLMWTYYLPQWGYLCLIIAIPIAGMHLGLHPLREMLRWRLDFGAPGVFDLRPQFQFGLRALLATMVGMAVALAVIRGACTILAHSGDADLLGMPIYRLFCFGQILVPALACAWMVLGHKRQWIGGLVLVLAVICPWFLVQTSWYTYLNTVPSQLWPAHWMNLGAVSRVMANVVCARLLGLRLVRIA